MVRMSYKSLEEGGFTKTDQSPEKIPPECNEFFLVLMIVLLFVFMFIVITCISAPPMEFNITEASITQFNITSNNILYYNFSVSIAVTNFENQIYDFEGKKMNAISSYKGNQLNSVTMVPFFLGSKNTIRLQPIVFEGNSLIKLDRKQLDEYNKETQLGIYNLHLELSKYMVCPTLRIPMISNGNLVPTFKVVKCSYDRYHR
ncbi:hypothetical protein P8452_69412 [Trifolium repens]|nr:hypothetical protein P8452_69412 [Trifolium repens]